MSRGARRRPHRCCSTCRRTGLHRVDRRRSAADAAGSARAATTGCSASDPDLGSTGALPPPPHCRVRAAGSLRSSRRLATPPLRMQAWPPMHPDPHPPTRTMQTSPVGAAAHSPGLAAAVPAMMGAVAGSRAAAAGWRATQAGWPPRPHPHHRIVLGERRRVARVRAHALRHGRLERRAPAQAAVRRARRTHRLVQDSAWAPCSTVDGRQRGGPPRRRASGAGAPVAGSSAWAADWWVREADW